MVNGSRMYGSTQPNEPLPLHIAARHLRVPARWLRDEIESGRLPALRAGRTILIHVPTVAAALAERAKAERADHQEEGGDA